MHRDDPICRARVPLRGLSHILQLCVQKLQSQLRRWLTAADPGVSWLERCILGSISWSAVVKGGWGKGIGKWCCCPLSDLSWGVMEHTGAQWVLATSPDPQPQHTRDELGTSLSETKGQRQVYIDKCYKKRNGWWYCFGENFVLWKYYFPHSFARA